MTTEPTTERAPEPKRVARRWLRNGDHPAVLPFPSPALAGPDPDCYKPWPEHGWIDEGPGGKTVCPGDLVIDLPDGTHEVVKLDRPVYRDRCDSYVPYGLHLDGQAQQVEVSEPRRLNEAWALEMLAAADRLFASMFELEIDHQSTKLAQDVRDWLSRYRNDGALWSGMPRPARVARLALASPDELNGGDRDWWWADVSGDGTHWSRFDGHRVQVDVELHTSNHRDVNDWKGRDEIRAGGEWGISLNRQQVDGGYVGRDVPRTLREIAQRVERLTADSHIPLDHTDPRPYAEQLIGRRVYYREVPAVIVDTVLDQGCVMLKPVGRSAFPRDAYDLDSEPDGTGHDEQDLYDEGEARTAKVEIDSPLIWWWRKRPYSPDEPDKRYRPMPPEGELQSGPEAQA